MPPTHTAPQSGFMVDVVRDMLRTVEGDNPQQSDHSHHTSTGSINGGLSRSS
jgi:hypothetical protein